MGNLKKFGSHGDQIPQMETKFPKWGPTSISANISEYQVQTKFQMFTITSDVPCDMPILASSEQERFAAANQDVLSLGPLQPTHVPVQALRYRIWNSGPSSKKLYKGKIQAFGTKSGLFWDHFCTFLGLLVVIFIKMPKNLQKAKKASKTV